MAQAHGAVAVAREQTQPVARGHGGPRRGRAVGSAHRAQQPGVDKAASADLPVAGDEAQQVQQVGGGGGQLPAGRMAKDCGGTGLRSARGPIARSGRRAGEGPGAASVHAPADANGGAGVDAEIGAGAGT